MSPRRMVGSGLAFGLEVVNGKLVRQGLENFLDATPKIGRLRIYRTMQRIFVRLGVYPSQRPYKRYQHKRSRSGGKGAYYKQYKRTYELRRSRKMEKLDQGYMIRNDPVDKRGTHYAIYVRGDAGGGGQARGLRDWLPLKAILDIELAQFPQEVIDDLTVELIKEQTTANVT